MKKFVALILGSALTILTAGSALAASAAAVESPATKPAATAGAPSAQPSAVAPAATPVAAPAPAPTPAATTSAAPAAAAKEQPTRTGYIDMSRLASEIDSGKAATTALKEKSQKLKAKIEAKQKQIEKQKAAIDAKIETMAPKERAAKAKEFQKKVEEYQKLVRASELEMQELEEKLTTDVYKSIKAAATEYGQSHGYATIFDKKGSLYLADMAEIRDLTDEIAKVLNKKPAVK